MKKFNTLGLNMIIGPGDGNNLKRCLESIDAKNFFDEIVLVATTHDRNVWKIAKEFTDRLYFQQWTCKRYPFGNFARARNLAIDKSTTDLLMWLDCDDIYPKKCLDRLPFVKEGVGLSNGDYYLVEYKINFRDKDRFGTSTVRERIFRRCKEIRWHRPVHEELLLDSTKKQGNLKGIWIEHRETKPDIASLSRNMLILKHEIDIEEADDTEKSFYAIELLNSKEKQTRDKAIHLLKEVFYNREMKTIHLASISARIAIETMKDENFIEAETYSRLSLDLYRKFAEPHVILGDIYGVKGEIDKALLLYKEAMTKELFVGGSQNVAYYKDIPARRIMNIYIDKKEYEMALVFNKKTLEYLPDNKHLLETRKEILSKLTEG